MLSVAGSILAAAVLIVLSPFGGIFGFGPYPWRSLACWCSWS